MGFFKFDEDNATTAFEMVAEGVYEATVNNAEARKSKNGSDFLSVDFEIRADVNQKHQGAKILYNGFTFEHEVSVRIVNSLIKACGFPNGTDFASPEDLANKLIGKNLCITVKHEADYQDKSKLYAKAKYYNPSKLGSAATDDKKLSLDEDDLPF